MFSFSCFVVVKNERNRHVERSRDIFNYFAHLCFCVIAAAP